MPTQIRDLSDLTYAPQNFSDLADTEIGRALWDFLKHRDNLVRMETATILERAAVEPLAAPLVEEFGDQVGDDRTKQMLGHMVRQIMEGLGYEIDRTGLRITRPSLFTSGAGYRIPERGDRPMKITRAQRDAWLTNTANSPFNRWLDKQVKPGGALNLEMLYDVARKYGIEKRYDHLNPGQQRMNVGVMLRTRVPPAHYQGQ